MPILLQIQVLPETCPVPKRFAVIYIVLGMHKSGTTLVSQILHHSGISMGTSFEANVDYDGGNQFEDDTPYRLNLEFLQAPDDQVLYLETPANMAVNGDQRGRMNDYVSRRNRETDRWGFKDPRTCLTYPLWEKELPEHRIIAVYRAAEEIWPRFRGQGLLDKPRDISHSHNFLLRWCEHNDNVQKFVSRTSMDFIMISYRELMNGDDEFRRLEHFIGQPLEDRRRKKLYRSKMKSYMLLEMMKKHVRNKSGYDTDRIFEQLAEVRSSQLAAATT